MNLIIDVGNSFVKFAVFDKGELIDKQVKKSDKFLKGIKKVRKTFPKITKVIIASVGKLKKEDLEYINLKYKVLALNAKSKIPFQNHYETPKTLGLDRIALVSASVQQFPNKNVLIVDAGTCITYDFINSKNQYLGGAISPGIRMRYKALHSLTEKLPLLDTEIPQDITGKTTANSIHSGIVNGVLKEIDGVVEDYKQKYSDLTVILTGGDTNFLSKQLKSSIFANSNFLLEGLNYILQFNSN